MEKLTTVEEILVLYKAGQRKFKGLDIEGDFSNESLNGILFDECFIAADFKYCNLSNSTFKNGNIKTSDFRYSNLTNAKFINLSVESTNFDWANTNGIKFTENYCYGQLVPESDFEVLFKTNISKPKFKIVETFKITNRGYVICGTIQEGMISIGDTVSLENQNYDIIGVEMIDKLKSKIGYIGLVIAVNEEPEIQKIKSQKLEGKTIEIIKGKG